MKMILMLSTLFTLAFSFGASAHKRSSIKQTLEQQIASLAYYPDVLEQAQGEGLVIIRFRISADSRLADLSVSAGDNAKLNATLIKQLTGKKVFLSQPTPPNAHQEYQARLQFRLI